MSRWRKLNQGRQRVTKDGQRFTKSIYGPWLRNTPGDLTFQFCVDGYGSYIPRIIKQDRGDFLFLDIGANLGVFSLVANARRRCKKVVSFEPIPSTFEALQANLQQNRARKVTAICGAVSTAEAEQVFLSFNPDHSGLSKIQQGSTDQAIAARRISANDMAEIVPDTTLPILAKIDVEGAETQVLQVLAATPFYPRVNELIIEISEEHHGHADKAELLALLKAQGFREMSRMGGASHYDAYYRREPA